MDVGRSKARDEARDDKDSVEESPVRDHKDGKKEKEHRSKDRGKEYDRENNKEKEREREREKDHRRDKEKERDRRRDRDGEFEKEGDRNRDKERGKDKNRDRDRDRDRDREKERERDRAKQDDREKRKDREKDKEIEKDRHREKIKEKSKEKENDVDKQKDRSTDRERSSRKKHKEDDERNQDVGNNDHDDGKYENKDESRAAVVSGGDQGISLDLEERITKMREERLMKKSEGASEILSWVSKSRKLEEKRTAEKEKAHQLSKLFEEQDNLGLGESEDEGGSHHASHDLAGVKVLHGLDKVMEGGAVVLTLKDQNILADGDINTDVDMLENIEIGEQKRREEAYRAAKKKTGTYADKFNDDPGAEKKMLPQYDDPADDVGVTLDEKGRFTVAAEKKLEELRRRIQGQTANHVEDLSSSAKSLSDYYTHEEMLQFKKPKKKKSLRKKDKLDIAALEAEAVAAGLGSEDLGSRTDSRRQAIREEQEKTEAEQRSKAYQSAYAKAEEASRLLRMEQVRPPNAEEDENVMFADDDEDFHKSLVRARRIALKNQESVDGPQNVARLASSAASQIATDDKNPTGGDLQETKVVLTEMEEFVWGLQLDEDVRKPDSEDVFMEEDEAPRPPVKEMKEEASGWAEIKESGPENPPSVGKEELVPDETIHEVAVGKGLSGALKLLKDRGTLKETVEWGGRNMDKKKSKLVGIVDTPDGGNERFKDIRIERTDEFGRTLTPKEAFRLLSHKFHGKGPGKMKQEKRMKQYEEELKLKQMKNSDTPSHSVERMREAQAQLKTPYLVLSGNVKPGQTSDPQSGFATVEKNFPGSLTPMLGDRKVEHFLGIKRKHEADNSSTPKKPRT